MKALSFFFILTLASLNLKGQPFSSIEIGGSLSQPSIQDASYSSRWDLTSSKSLQFRTPFYIGTAGLSVEFFDYISKKEFYSNIKSVNYSAYLGYKIFQSKRILLYPGVQVGIQKSNFNNDRIGTKNTEERELLLGVNLEVQLKISPIILFSDLKYAKVYNFYRQNLYSVGIGGRINFSLPKKVYEFIE